MVAVDAVIFDLFGTLINAPTDSERRDAARELAIATGAKAEETERYLINSWNRRHNGTLPTVMAVAIDLVATTGGTSLSASRVANKILDLARKRLFNVDTSVCATLSLLRQKGLHVALLSDASPDIGEMWPQSPLASLFDGAIFSYSHGVTKPNPKLYEKVLETLILPAENVLYCGDGGGGELQGAIQHGMQVIGVRRRGAYNSLAFNEKPWFGNMINSVEDILIYLEL